MTTRLTPSEAFPEDLSSLSLPQVEVLNSKIQRELSHEYEHNGEPHPETEFRNEELTDELDRREAEDEPLPGAAPHSEMPVADVSITQVPSSGVPMFGVTYRL